MTRRYCLLRRDEFDIGDIFFTVEEVDIGVFPPENWIGDTPEAARATVSESWGEDEVARDLVMCIELRPGLWRVLHGDEWQECPT